MPKIFILSPARTAGKRGLQLTNPQAKFALAHRLQKGESVPIGEIFSFLSGLYFRGKMAYVKSFAEPDHAFVITSNQGLVSVDTPISLSEFQSFAEVEIDLKNDSYRRPLEIDLAAWAQKKETTFILLGSIASPKYTKVLHEFLGDRLYVPRSFRGMGDMSRGALMLKQAAAKKELDYECFA